jgi:hypothetical protein
MKGFGFPMQKQKTYDEIRREVDKGMTPEQKEKNQKLNEQIKKLVYEERLKEQFEQKFEGFNDKNNQPYNQNNPYQTNFNQDINPYYPEGKSHFPLTKQRQDYTNQGYSNCKYTPQSLKYIENQITGVESHNMYQEQIQKAQDEEKRRQEKLDKAGCCSNKGCQLI